jgi:amphi-Trp domain-containing protein
MASEERGFEHESLQDRESIVKYLAAVGEGIAQGKLTLTSNGDRLFLEAPSLVKFDIQAKQKRSRTQLVLKLSWKSDREGKELKVEPLSIEVDDTSETA